MHPRHLCARHGKHAEGVVVAQVCLGGERELGNVSQRVQVVRVHALVVEFFAVVRHVVVGVLQAPLQALQLQRGNFIAAGGFNGVQIAGLGLFDGHGACLREVVLALPGWAGLGLAWLGLAWLGLAWLGLAWRVMLGSCRRCVETIGLACCAMGWLCSAAGSGDSRQARHHLAADAGAFAPEQRHRFSTPDAHRGVVHAGAPR
jgi:hypothetical protein